MYYNTSADNCGWLAGGGFYNTERWPSGWRRCSRKAVWRQRYRGFESLPLRQEPDSTMSLIVHIPLFCWRCLSKAFLTAANLNSSAPLLRATLLARRFFSLLRSYACYTWWLWWPKHPKADSWGSINCVLSIAVALYPTNQTLVGRNNIDNFIKYRHCCDYSVVNILYDCCTLFVD